MTGKKWEQEAFGRAFPQGAIRVMEFNSDEPYEGSGQAIAFDPTTGEFLVAEYGHCSCFGPDEGMGGVSRYDSLLDAVRGVTSYYRENVLNAFRKEVDGVS